LLRAPIINNNITACPAPIGTNCIRRHKCGIA
jgi:hypothetical protein